MCEEKNPILKLEAARMEKNQSLVPIGKCSSYLPRASLRLIVTLGTISRKG